MQVEVWDKNGNVMVVESVDARELVASGEYFFQEPVENKPTRGRKLKVEANVMDVVPDVVSELDDA